jgi:16S rRNA (cytosine967-C5)-methyltransferase
LTAIIGSPVHCVIVNARRMIYSRIADRARQFPDLDPEPIAAEALSLRDAALLWAIDHAVTRRWLTLAAVIESRLTERNWHDLHPAVQAALLVGSAQLLLLEKIPDHAAIDQSVRWIKSTRRATASGLVNAVLRNIAALRGERAEHGAPISATADLPRDAIVLDDGRWLALNEAIFSENQMTRLSQQTSHREELLSHWTAMFGQRATTELALHGMVHAPTIVSAVTGADLGNPLMQPHEQPGFAVFTGHHAELEQLLRSHPHIRVQDPATARAVDLARAVDPAPSLVIDYCAGKGTKTKQLAAMFPEASVIATDKDAERFAVLQQSLKATQNVELVPFRSIRDFVGRANLLVLDVPCSNTGVLARRLEARYRFSRQSLDSLVTLQRQILADAIPLMSDAAWMLYTTCSVEPGEDQQQTAWMVKHLRLELVQEHFTLPAGLPGEPLTKYHDGGYGALLRWRTG